MITKEAGAELEPVPVPVADLVDTAESLATAGVRCVELRIDALEPDCFARTGRPGRLERVLAGLEAALAAGLAVHVRAEIRQGVNEREIVPLALLSFRRPIHVRFHGPGVLARLRAALGPLEERTMLAPAGASVAYAITGACGTIAVADDPR
jgi:hypothetical protein